MSDELDKLDNLHVADIKGGKKPTPRNTIVVEKEMDEKTKRYSPSWAFNTTNQ